MISFLSLEVFLTLSTLSPVIWSISFLEHSNEFGGTVLIERIVKFKFNCHTLYNNQFVGEFTL